MTTGLTGGCACGNVRYECSERPLVQMICHCRDCQRASGSAFAASLVVPSDRLQLFETSLRFFEMNAESGNTKQGGFCKDCGSPILAKLPGAPLVTFLTASSLDEPSDFSPALEVWVSRAQPWQRLHADTLKFDKNPSREAMWAPIKAYFASRT